MLYDFEPLNESELGVHEGDLVYVISEFSEGWVVARRVEEFNNKDDYKLQEIEGIIPYSYIDWNFDLQFSLEWSTDHSTIHSLTNSTNLSLLRWK